MSQSSLDSKDTAPIEDKALDKEDVIKFLGEEDTPEEQETLELESSPKKSDKKTPEKGDEDTEETKEEKGDDEEETLEIEDLDKEDELDYVNPPSRKEILAKHPNIFKDFPQLERAFYREQKYSEILPTIEDAKEAKEKAETLDKYDKEIMSGSSESLLTSVKDRDKEAFARVVDNYLPTLHKVDEAAYYHTIGNMIKHTIISMVKDSKEQGDEDLGTAASILNKYIFGTDKFTHPQRLSKEEVSNKSGEKEDVSEREKKFIERQYNTAKDDLGTRIDNVLKATVDKAIDPNDSMTAYVKKTASREVLEGLESAILKDTRFRSIYDKLWEKAAANDFDKESMDRIKSAYLSKAKTLLPVLIQKARQEALKGSKRTTDDKDRKGPIPPGKIRTSASLTSGKPNGSSSKPIPRGMTTLEFLNSED